MLKIDNYIKEKQNLINDRLKELIPLKKDVLNQGLYEAANYSLHPGGKRLRSVILLATVETMIGDLDGSLDIACAIELIHTYSLIHDDLPCMDDDSLRRGKKALHIKYDEATAILTGDFLLTYAFEVIANTKAVSAIKKTNIIACLAKHIGAEGMVGGQFLDILLETEEITKEKLDFMHKNKTAALIEATLEIGAIITSAKKDEYSALKNFGKSMGFAYQLVDDILDIGTEDNKKTAVSFLGEEKAKKMAMDFYDNGVMELSRLSYPPPLLKDLAYKFVYRKK